jgi:hypothetical protein
VVFGVQRGSIASHLTDVVVNGAHQLLAVGAAILPAKDEVVAKPAELGQAIRLLRGGASWTVSALSYPPLLACWPVCSSLATVRLIGGDGDAITSVWR